MDWRKCQSCGVTGYIRSWRGSCCRKMSGISCGVGLPIDSVRIPIMLWKYVVVRRPPLYHVEYVAFERIVTPGLFSAMKRLCIAPATSSNSESTKGSKLKLNGSRNGGENITVPAGPD